MLCALPALLGSGIGEGGSWLWSGFDSAEAWVAPSLSSKRDKVTSQFTHLAHAPTSKQRLPGYREVNGILSSYALADY